MSDTTDAKTAIIARDADLAPGEVIQAEIGTSLLAIYKLEDGSIWATDDLCTHGQAFLSEGFLEDDGTIECPLHGGCFDVRTGEPTELPCEIALRTYPIKVIDGEIVVTLEG